VSKVKEYMDQGDAPAADAEAPADPQSDT
jgi:hypothetical protein